MLYLQPYTLSVDRKINEFIDRFYNNYLIPELGLNNGNCMCCGRVVRNNVKSKSGESGYIPELFYNGDYIGSDGTSNRGGLFFENGKFISFLGDVSRKKLNSGDYIGRFELIIFADMSIITPAGISTSIERLDEILLSGIETFVTVNGCGFTVKETTLDIDKVLERYSGSQKRNALTRNLSDSNNVSSFCAMKLILEVAYDPAQYIGIEQPFQNNMIQQSLVFFIKDTPDPSKVINVGGGVTVYQEYAPTDVLIVTRTDNDKPYFTGYNVQMVVFNNTPDTLASMIGVNSTGSYDRTGQGDPYGFMDGNFISITYTNIN